MRIPIVTFVDTDVGRLWEEKVWDSFQWWEVLNEELLSEAEVIGIALTQTRRTVGWGVGCM